MADDLSLNKREIFFYQKNYLHSQPSTGAAFNPQLYTQADSNSAHHNSAIFFNTSPTLYLGSC